MASGCLWPLLAGVALAGSCSCASASRREPDRCRLAALVGLATASPGWSRRPPPRSRRDAARLRVRPPLPGPGTGPRAGPAAGGAAARDRLALPRLRSHFRTASGDKCDPGRGSPLALGVAVADRGRHGYPVQRHDLENRYENPSFTTPGLNSAFSWSRSASPTPASRPPRPASTRSSAPISPTPSGSSAKSDPTAAS